MDSLARIVSVTYDEFLRLKPGDGLLFVPDYWLRTPSPYADNCRNQYIESMFAGYYEEIGPLRSCALLDIRPTETTYLRRLGTSRVVRDWSVLFRRTR